MKENSKVADTNVGNIKEDIKILENWLKELNELFKNTHINNTKERKALEHILSDYKRGLKENEELEEINNALEAVKDEAIRRYNFETIPIKKVKDKIEEYKNMLKTCNKAQDIDRIKAINERVLELQELIEESED